MPRSSPSTARPGRGAGRLARDRHAREPRRPLHRPARRHPASRRRGLRDAADASSRGGRLDIEIVDREGCLEIRVGPLVAGAAERLLEEMELPGPLAGSLRGARQRDQGRAGRRRWRAARAPGRRPALGAATPSVSWEPPRGAAAASPAGSARRASGRRRSARRSGSGSGPRRSAGGGPCGRARRAPRAPTRSRRRTRRSRSPGRSSPRRSTIGTPSESSIRCRASIETAW